MYAHKQQRAAKNTAYMVHTIRVQVTGIEDGVLGREVLGGHVCSLNGRGAEIELA